MKTKIAALAAAIGGVVTALVGSESFGDNAWVTNVAIAGLAITMVRNMFTTENISRDLRNGTFEDLIREAIKKIAADERTSLEIRQESREEENPNGRQDV